ncbi:MAG: M12 family metallo-peptidase [Candidatus Gracilibacteria bacterium]|jgi:hypothetical protein
MKQKIIACIFCLMLLLSPVGQANAGFYATQTQAKGFDIYIDGNIELVGPSVTKQVVAQYQAALDEYYNNMKFIYKCYRVHFNLQVKSSEDWNKINSLTTLVQIVDVTKDKETKTAYEKYGLYSWYDWEEYDKENGSDISGACDSHKDGIYNVKCAEKTQWFHDSGKDNGAQRGVLAYASQRSVNYDGEQKKTSYAVIPNSASASTIAHEIGHTLGFVHPNKASDSPCGSTGMLMDACAGNNTKAITMEDLYNMLKRMKLECRYDIELPNVKFTMATIVSECPGQSNEGCLVNFASSAVLTLRAETSGLDLTGSGELKHTKTVDNNNCGKVSHQDGIIEVSGDFNSYLGSKDTEPGLNLHITHTYSKEPWESFGLSTPFIKNWLNKETMEGFFPITDLSFIFGDYDDTTKITGPINMSLLNYSTEAEILSPPVSCVSVGVVEQLKTGSLKLKSVEPFRNSWK